MNDAAKALFARTTQGIKPGLEVITALLAALDNPYRQFGVIHVAGTNGKGSVCAMLESVLRASGFKTGLYTSPHLIDFSERFRINGAPIPEDKLEQYIESVEAASNALSCRPATFFEISTAIAFQYFADEAVDIAIIETGMGGRWDATNVVIPLVSVITRIDIDHADYLGDTIEEIATEKAGIIKPGRPAVSAPQSSEAMAVLRGAGEPIISTADAVSVIKVGEPQKLKIETPARNLPPIHLPLLGECQRENCAVAVAALEILSDLIDFEPEFKKGLEAVKWEGRFQCLHADPLMILDGAHNPSAARALIKTLKENHAGHQVGCIMGFLEDKDSVGFLRRIKPAVSKAWTVSIDAQRGILAEQAADQCRV
ncbi:MAG: bifunctional folylpolyglutamate synthase/dihydrofolate synthase, partial [Pontiella sp.]|nr:bifunctional folylpolyglutamate synthase/dihydrofolate synthase [Pontiella sp.]